MSTSFDGLISKVKECGQKTVSVAVAQDSAVLEAVRAAKDRGIANAILVGDEEKIKATAAAGGIDISDFEIYSIYGDEDHRYAYEMFNKNPGNAVRVQMYINVGHVDDLSPFQLMLKTPTVLAGLGDEVWVTFGTLNRTHLVNTYYQLRWLTLDESMFPYLLREDDFILQLESGGGFLLEQ